MAASNMSTTDTYNALLSTTLRNYRKKLEDNIFIGLPLFYWLNEKGRKRTLDGGYSIMVPLLYGENTTVGVYEDYDTLDVTPQEGITTAEYNWGQAAVSISISRAEERKNSGPHRLINLLEAKTMQAEKSLQWYLNDRLHGIYGSNGTTYAGKDSNSYDSVGGTNVDAGSTAKGFISLDHIVRSGWGYADNDGGASFSHTVGGITVAVDTDGAGSDYSDWDDVVADTYTNPWWLNYSNPGFGRLQRGAVGGKVGDVLSETELDYAGNITTNSNQNVISAMRSMYNRLSDGGDTPDLGLTGQDVFETYEGALMPLERFTDTKLGDAGFQNLKFKGMTLIFDHGITTNLPDADASTSNLTVPLYMLNSKYLDWTVDQETDFFTTDFYRPENQDARTAQILLMAQLTCSNRSKHGVISCAAGADYTP